MKTRHLSDSSSPEKSNSRKVIVGYVTCKSCRFFCFFVFFFSNERLLDELLVSFPNKTLSAENFIYLFIFIFILFFIYLLFFIFFFFLPYHFAELLELSILTNSGMKTCNKGRHNFGSLKSKSVQIYLY